MDVRSVQHGRRAAWRVECGVWSVECGVWSVECGWKSTAPYRGGAPGAFTPLFWVFLATWAPVFLLGGYLVRRLRRH
jgi:hypothetical protein